MLSHATPTSDEASAWIRTTNIRKIIQQSEIFFPGNSVIQLRYCITVFYEQQKNTKSFTAER